VSGLTFLNHVEQRDRVLLMKAMMDCIVLLKEQLLTCDRFVDY
jgi:hypothetical protein